jgi:hypothetical protein
MHPLVGRDLLRRRQLDHVHRRRVAAFPAGPAFRRGLKLPDRRIDAMWKWSVEGIEGHAKSGKAENHAKKKWLISQIIM